MRASRVIALVLFGLVMFVGPRAFAQAKPSLAESLTGEAKAAYVSARVLLDDGDFAGAEIKFKAAYDLSSDARLLWNMAACEKSLRHYARTEQLVRDYLEKGGALLTDQDRADAKSLLDTIDSFTVRLTINVNEPGAEIFVDEVSVGKSPLAKPVVVDIGARQIVVKKDGFKSFEQQLPVGGAATAKLDVKLDVQVHEGSVHVTTPQLDAEIFLDGKRVGVGRFDGKLRSGGHTLRIVAAGMRPYQTEIVVNDDESRVIDTPALEVAPPPQKPKLWWPGGETSASLGLGAKLDRGSATFFATRFDIGVKFGAPTELGLFVDIGSIDPGSNNCGTQFHGPNPTSPNDVDVRYAFQSCFYFKPGIFFAIHFTPRSKVDVWSALDIGTSATFVSGKQLDPLHGQMTELGQASILASADAGARIGVDYHPFMRAPVGEARTSTASRWAVGLFGAFTFTIIGQDAPNTNNGNNNSSTPPTTGNNDKDHASWPSFLFGARTSLTF